MCFWEAEGTFEVMSMYLDIYAKYFGVGPTETVRLAFVSLLYHEQKCACGYGFFFVVPYNESYIFTSGTVLFTFCL